MAEAAVRGFQGSDFGQPDRVVACLKHYVGYGAAEGGRDYNATEIGLPTLRNIYLPPFKAGVEAGAGTLMSAFNCLNGVPASGNRFTLNDVLRGEWHFQGFVVSDWGAVSEVFKHGYAADEAQAAAISLTAGVDMDMASDTYEHALSALMDQGKLSEQTLNTAVERILRIKFMKGLFNSPYTQKVKLDAAANQALAREAAARCCVLLKNAQATLPLKDGVTVALIGPMAEDQYNMLGCWAGVGNKKDIVTLKNGLAAAMPTAHFQVAEGCALTGSDLKGIEQAVALARQANVVILALGEPKRWSGEACNRCELGLPGVQQQLFDAVVAVGKPVVTVLFAGRPLAVPEVLEKSSAVLMAWHPGVQAGTGVADVLTGKVEPSGRLTVTFPRTVGQLPNYYNYLPLVHGTGKYVDGDREPLLPFGFGLTYTEFKYGPTRLSSATVSDKVTATVTISNEGQRAGSEVAQLYLRDIACSMGVRPIRELKGYERVTLKPGEKKEVSFTLARKDLGSYSPDGKWVVEPGQFEVTIAPNAISGTMQNFTLLP
jgi:beta-glucosidase